MALLTVLNPPSIIQMAVLLLMFGLWLLFFSIHYAVIIMGSLFVPTLYKLSVTALLSFLLLSISTFFF